MSQSCFPLARCSTFASYAVGAINGGKRHHGSKVGGAGLRGQKRGDGIVMELMREGVGRGGMAIVLSRQLFV